MYVIPYPDRPIRWTQRVAGAVHRLPAHRKPTVVVAPAWQVSRHPNRPVRLVGRVAGAS